MSEEDLWAGLWTERCRYPETAIAIAYEAQGLFEQAQESYEMVRMCITTIHMFMCVILAMDKRNNDYCT